MAKKASTGAKAKYRALSHITHNEETYGPGTDNAEIELTETEAAPLLADKAIEPVNKADEGTN